MIRHYNIPVFLPELACPFRCSYCNQSAVSGQQSLPDADEIRNVIERNLQSFTHKVRHVEIAFFGGSFTGLPLSSQAYYLNIAQPYLQNKHVQGIRISTRPDYIDTKTLEFLKTQGVKTIELGAQSLDDEVLQKSGRGHSVADVIAASQLILEHGFRLGLQMMIGLPADNFEKASHTAQQIIDAGAHETRIYPCLVLHDTALEQLYRQGGYVPLSLSEAVEWSVALYLLFEKSGVVVLRTGLHASEELDGYSLVAGPYHPSFKALVMSAIWGKQFNEFAEWTTSEGVIIFTASKELNFAVGHEAINKKKLLDRYQKVFFKADPQLERRDFYIQGC